MTGVTVVKLMFCMLTVFGSRKFFVLETWERLWHIDTNVKLFYIWRLTVESARSSLFWRPESEYHTLTLMSNGCCVCDSWQFFLFWRPESDYDTLTLMSNWCVWQQTFLCCRSLRVMITSWHWCQTDVCVVWQLTVLCSRGLRAMITSWHWCQTDVVCVWQLTGGRVLERHRFCVLELQECVETYSMRKDQAEQVGVTAVVHWHSSAKALRFTQCWVRR